MPKRKLQRLTIKEKLEIIEELDKGIKPAAIGLKYGIPKQTVSKNIMYCTLYYML